MSDEGENKSTGGGAGDALTAIASVIGTAACGVVFLFNFFGGGNGGWPAAVAVTALAAMGLGMAYFLTRKG